MVNTNSEFMEKSKTILTIIEGLLFVIAAVIVKLVPDLKVHRPIPLSHTLIRILFAVVIILGFIVI